MRKGIVRLIAMECHFIGRTVRPGLGKSRTTVSGNADGEFTDAGIEG